MTMTRTFAVGLAGMMILAAVGCATGSSGPSDEELIGQMLNGWIAASKAKDVDKVMTFMSENFKHDGYDYAAESKADMRAFMEGSLDMGNFDDLEVTYDAEGITIEGDTAQVTDIEWSCAPGTAMIDFTLKKEAGVWRIIDADVEEF
ncbi:MAG: nuclear transport factor 2 family protein [bacterium]|nr:nuclear transport factor 2 family protein [bacterium]